MVLDLIILMWKIKEVSLISYYYYKDEQNTIGFLSIDLFTIHNTVR